MSSTSKSRTVESRTAAAAVPAAPAAPVGSVAAGRLRSRAGLLAVSGGAVLWGTTGVAVQIVHDRTGLAAVPIGCLRLAAASVAMVLLALATRSLPRWRAVVRAHPVGMAVAGAGLALYQALYFVGVQDVGVSVSTLVSLAAAPVALTVGAAVHRRRRPALPQLLTLGAALGGLALICLRSGTGTGQHVLVGLLASVGSGLGYAATTVLNRRLAADGDPLVLTGVTSVVGAVVLVPFALLPALSGGAGLFWPADPVASWWLGYIGVASTCVAYGLFYLGLRSVSGEVAGILTLLEPLTAALLAAVALHEHLTAPALLGAALLLAAVAGLYVRGPEPTPAAVAEPPGA